MISWNFQGRVIPCDFIGVVKSQQPVYLKGISHNHIFMVDDLFEGYLMLYF